MQNFRRKAAFNTTLMQIEKQPVDLFFVEFSNVLIDGDVILQCIQMAKPHQVWSAYSIDQVLLN